MPPDCATNFPNTWHGSQIQRVLQQMQCNRTGSKCLVLHSHPSHDKQGSSGKCRSNDTSDTHMVATILVYSPTNNVIQRPLLLPALPTQLLNSLVEIHPLVKTRSLNLAAWKITGKPWKSKEFQAVQPNLFSCPADQV